MPLLEISVIPEIAYDEAKLEAHLRKVANVRSNESIDFRLERRNIDARGKKIKVNLQIAYEKNRKLAPRELCHFEYQDVSEAPEVHIIGFGPAGMWAALRCLELGFKPIVIERGKDVRSRRRDLKAVNRDNLVDSDSNYCFGEGGAGTYSDGKLYTRSKKRGNMQRILDSLVEHGAVEDILFEAHPHIGTNKLPKIVQAIRETILKYGGEVHFETRLTDLVQEGNRIIEIRTSDGKTWPVQALIMATGHSARDIYYLLHEKGIRLEAKPFAMGVRVEHPQKLINKIQYHGNDYDEILPAASYKLVQQVDGRGVYSFCMCPGGFIVPAATAQEELVVNGMSPSKRDNNFANSGIVVAIELEDLSDYKQYGPLAGLEFQKEVEKKVWEAGGSTQQAAAQRLVDFVKGRISPELNPSSYIPGLISMPMHEILPPFMAQRLQAAFVEFGKKMPGYYSNEANIVGIESRTSSPVRIPRDRESYQHPEIKNLFPSGEGAGFAGGIVSAGMDGERCAEAAAHFLESK
ncbi:NAD(P)/FAD-dependent oxidoreductase [Croceimicrobium hydrocarbonivorans]|uniref:FAD-binding protein n=1 Tax=Croceimicrobium hydrocarbonivorans TaxID=2761580 RepID=A0A7H0VGL1_9FLAO|nr:FAD-binding protein [Croceimicrobium hydrocarbonivorans]QNR24859.1 FAD-binding protein [Croceimicrobium hydrocarbonivorans]